MPGGDVAAPSPLLGLALSISSFWLFLSPILLQKKKNRDPVSEMFLQVL